MLGQCPWFGGYGSPWLMLFPLGMFILILVAILFWRRGGMCWGPWGPMDRGMNQHRSPLDILKERYARGEISKDEFDRIKKDIE